MTLQRRGWTGGLGAGVWRALESPRQLWLASLGGTALTIRGARAAWSHVVAEGVAVEEWLRRSLGGAAEPPAPES